MPATDSPSPLSTTVARADAAHEWLTIVLGPLSEGWLRCSDVDADVVSEWERGAAEVSLRYDGRAHPVTSASYALGWYADIAARVGAACFLLDRRVPRLDASVVAFRKHAEDHYPDAVALLDPRFWCLPDDPAADHPDATVLPDERSLADRLRAEVRAHADDFLSWHRPGTRLPRRDRLGAFFDSLDVGFWLDDTPTAPAIGDSLAAAQLVLPGATPEFADRSSLYALPDATGRPRLTRRRVSCCNYYRVSDIAEACTTCPRTSDEERALRVAQPEPAHVTE